jgi:hypothetical protein
MEDIDDERMAEPCRIGGAGFEPTDAWLYTEL